MRPQYSSGCPFLQAALPDAELKSLPKASTVPWAPPNGLPEVPPIPKASCVPGNRRTHTCLQMYLPARATRFCKIRGLLFQRRNFEKPGGSKSLRPHASPTAPAGCYLVKLPRAHLQEGPCVLSDTRVGPGLMLWSRPSMSPCPD